METSATSSHFFAATRYFNTIKSWARRIDSRHDRFLNVIGTIRGRPFFPQLVSCLEEATVALPIGRGALQGSTPSCYQCKCMRKGICVRAREYCREVKSATTPSLPCAAAHFLSCACTCLLSQPYVQSRIERRTPDKYTVGSQTLLPAQAGPCLTRHIDAR